MRAYALRDSEAGIAAFPRGAALRPLALRAHPLVFGVVLFLASELMFFAGLFAAYFDLRGQTLVWPPANVHLNAVESSIGTLLLGYSSVAMLLFSRALSQRQVSSARLWLSSTIAAAIAFIVIAMHGWRGNTFGVASHAYGSVYYAMTGLHALHVAVGILLLGMLFFGMRSPALSADHRAGAEAISYYWHFVFIVWVAIWGTIYIIR
jgi:cytochrome c oxidase subunit 3